MTAPRFSRTWITNGYDADQSDLIRCLDCGGTVIVPRGQTIVLSRRQSGHTCGDPVWHVPEYTPPTTGRRRTRQEQPA